MTKLEYYRAYTAALKSGSAVTREIMDLLKDTYEAAGELAAEQVLNAELSGYADITIQSWQNIENALNNGARMISERLRELLDQGLLTTGGSVTAIDEKYLIDIIEQNNINLSTVGIENIFNGVNSNILLNTLKRIYTDGYTYSQRVWNVGVEFQKDIKRMITTDLALGRDLTDTARDLQAYIKGKQILAKRWGDLLEGNKTLLRRLRQVDYRALRLIRSELYASLQSVAAISGSVNPGCSGWYDWIRQSLIDWNCNCPENAAGSPYLLNDLPSYDHPNCYCIIRPRLRDRAEFVSDLKSWVNGESVGYLDDWFYNYYQYAA